MRGELVCITGGTGFLGGAIARQLLADGHRVRLVGRNPANIGALIDTGAIFAPADLRDGNAIDAAISGCDIVIHAGALSAPWGKRADFARANVDGTRNVLDACRKHRVRRLVYVSSPSVVFTGHDHVNLPDDAPYPTRFVSVYSETKKLAEDAVNASVQAGDVAAAIVRPKAIYGPGDTTLLPRLVDAARAGRLPRLGDGKNRIDLTYIDDAAAGVWLAAQAPEDKAVGRTFTITGGEAAPIWSVIADLLARLGIDWRPKTVPESIVLAAAGAMEAVAAISGREPRLTRYSVRILCRTQTHDISRARELLGYQPQVCLEEGINRTIAAWNQVANEGRP